MRLWVFATLLILLPSGLWAQPAPKANALIVWNSNGAQTAQAMVDSIVAQGGRVDHVFPPNAAIGYLPGGLAERLKERVAGMRIEQADAPQAEFDQMDQAAAVAATVWNKVFRAGPAAAPRPRNGRIPHDPPNDARIAPDRASRQGVPRAQAAPASFAPGFFDTSTFLIGSVTVGIITPESDGAIDTNLENWSTTRQNTVVAHIVQAMQWWKDNANAPANLSFVYDIHQSVPTSYEPIKRSSADEDLWISEVMNNLGYAGTPSTYFTQVRQYLNDKRTSMGTNWAFAIFVVDSLNDGNGMFASGDFAYTYVNGPFTVMTYDNDSWGIDGMPIVSAHETGHIWGALDEYASSGCTDTETSGYLNIANTNCENGTPATEDSIMRNATDQQDVAFPNHLVSTPARQMIGWRDSDGDGKELYDPVDTTPVVTLTPFAPDPTTNATPTYAGTANVPPYPSPTETDVTIDTIASVEWRVDGGSWQAATAADGAFDSDVENFNFTAAALAPGTHTFQVRATSNVGNVSALASDSVTFSPVVTIAATTPNASENGSTGIFTVSRSGATTQSLTVNYTVSGTATMGADYQSLSGSVTIPVGAASQTVTIVPIDDIIPETNETVVLTLSASASYTVGAQNGATVTIADNDGINPVAHVDCSSMSLQSVIDLAPAGSTILVNGTCTETILIANNVQRLQLDGGGSAVITAADPSAPALNVRGKGIAIQNFTITGGNAGVQVNRGSNAVIDHNLIQNVNGNGVLVDEMAFAVVTNNMIQNNSGAGVFVSENSTARIGFNSDTETSASANTIQNNGAGGIIVSNGSSARIIGNIIQNNGADGIFVTRDSHADVAGNALDGSAAQGVEVSDDSSLQLGEDSGSTMFDLPNSGSGNNGVGVKCTAGSVVDGVLGTLTGAGGPIDFLDPSCLDGL